MDRSQKLQRTSFSTANMHQTNSMEYKSQFYLPQKTQQTTTYDTTQNHGLIKNAPKNRDFKKTIPTNIVQDKERLYEELNKCKQQNNVLKEENLKQKNKILILDSELEKALKRQDSGDVQKIVITRKKTEQNNSSVVSRGSSSITYTLKKQIKELSDELESKEEELQKVKRNVKLTKIQELEAELKQYQDETVRLRSNLQQYLKYSFKFGNDKEENYLKQIQHIEHMTQICKELKTENDEMKERYTSLDEKYKEIQDAYMKAIKDKTLYKKLLDEKEKELDKLKCSDPYLNRKLNTSDAQIKIELERKLIECNELKNGNVLKDRKIHELEKKLKEQQSSHSSKLNQEIKEKNNWKEKSDKYKAELLELHEKYNQLVFSSRGQMLSSQQKRQTISSHSDSKNEEEKKPTQGQRRTTAKKIQTVRKEDIEQIAIELRYRLRGKNIRPTEIDLHLFPEKQKIEGQCSVSELISILQGEPFKLNSNESVTMARYLVEPQGERDILYNINIKNDNTSILHLFSNAIGSYGLVLGDEKVSIHNQIRNKLHESKGKMVSILEQKKKAENSQLPEHHYSRQSFLLAMMETTLDEEQQDILLQTIFELTKEFNMIDMEAVWQFYQEEGDIQVQKLASEDKRVSLAKAPPTEIVKKCIDSILQYGEANNYSIMDIRKIIDHDGGGYVERAELNTFMQNCGIMLDPMELMLVLDYFDDAGDGRISVNDIGRALKAEKERMDEQANKYHHQHKTKEEILNEVAKFMIDYMKNNKVDIVDIYNMIDQDGQGSISKDELRRLFRTKIVIPLQQNEFDDFFLNFDQSNDGQIEYAEFSKIMMKEVENITGQPYESFHHS